MTRAELNIYIELYKRKEYHSIPIGSYANRDYFYCTNKQVETLKLLSDDTTTSIGYGGAARCFTGETLVQTNKGHVPISLIKEGDFVLSFNEFSKKREYKKVLKKFMYNLAEPPKMAIFANNLKCTFDHEFLFRGKWTKANELRKRSLEKSNSDLLGFKHGKDSYRKPQGVWKIKTNEASSRQKWLFKNSFSNREKVKNSKSSQRGCKSIYQKPFGFRNSKSQELYKDRQSCGKLRMDVSGRKQKACLFEWKAWQYLEKRRETTRELFKKRRRQWLFKINRKTSFRNTCKIQTSKIHKRDASNRIQCKSIYNKRCNSKEVLESREITIQEIKNIKYKYLNEPIYDLHVEDNHNYTVTKNNIIVHNSGKTVIEVVAIIFDCLAYPDIAWGLARKELTTLKRTALLTLFKQLSFYGIETGEDYNYNQQLNKITFTNKSEIFLIDSAKHPTDPLHTRFGGFELTRCAVDESNETDQEIIDKLFERTGWRNNEKHGLKRKMFECFNPAKNHVYSKFYKPSVDGQEKEFRKFILALPTDNPNPAVAEWITDMLNDNTISESTKQRQIYGNFEFDDNPYAMFDYSKICDIFTNNYVQGNNQRYMTADIAYMGADLFTIFIWEGFKVIKTYGIDKIDETAIGTKIKELAELHKIPFSNIVYDADGLRKFTANSLKRLTVARGFVNNSAPIKDKQYRNLKSECAFMLKKYVDEGLIYIEDLTFKKQIIADLEQICRMPTDDEGKISLEPKKKFKERTGRSPDWFDALLMRFIFELKTLPQWA